MSGHDEALDATWALSQPILWESPDARSIPTLLAAIGQVLARAEEQRERAQAAERRLAAVEAACEALAEDWEEQARDLPGYIHMARRDDARALRAALATGGDQ